MALETCQVYRRVHTQVHPYSRKDLIPTALAELAIEHQHGGAAGIDHQ